MDRSRILVIIATALSFVAVLLGIANIGLSSGESEFQGPSRYFFTSGRQGIAIIPIQGVIHEGGFENSNPERIIEKILDAKRSSRIQAVILKVNSPGGSSAGTKQIYEQIRELRKIKPVYSVITDRATGGGYYIASASDRIYAREASVVGGMQTVQLKPASSRSSSGGGIRMESADQNSEDSNPNDLLEDAREVFTTDVSEGRGESIRKVRTWMGPQVASGKKAHAEQWIDEIGGLDLAVEGIKLQLKTTRSLPLFQMKDHTLMENVQGLLDRELAAHTDCSALSAPLLYIHTADIEFHILLEQCPGGERGTGK